MGLFNKKDADDDSNRSALFGSRKNKSSPAPSTNPYAQAAASDPYSQAKANAYSNGPPAPSYSNSQSPAPSANGGSRYGDNKSPAYTGGGGYGDTRRAGGGYGGGGYASGGGGGGEGGGYGASRYGAQSGYGGDRYGSSGAPGGLPAGPAGGSRYGGSDDYRSRTAAGLGGKTMSSRQQPDEDGNRDALFGGAKDRMAQRQPSGGYGAPPPAYGEGDAASGGGYGGSSQGGGYGAAGPTYGDRQLTAEEEEEEDVKATKQQIRFMKQEDVSSTRNALRIAQQAEESGRDTLARLGAQGEHIHNTEKNLDLAHNQNRIAEEKARELKTLNKSMFAVHVSNPFTASSRRQQRDQDVIDKHLEAREAREASRRAAFETDQRMQKTFHELGRGGNNAGAPQGGGRNLAERAKYQFEADSEDEEMENEIDSNLDALHGVAGRLNALARATGEEVDLQNKHLDRISEKGDRVDLGLAANKAKLDRIAR